jgi:hypothetical protein
MVVRGLEKRGRSRTVGVLLALGLLAALACEMPAPSAPISPSPPRLPSIAEMERITNGVGAPLVFVDGVRLPYADAETLDAECIESVELLKVPLAVARYGPEAAGGVLLITLERR